MLKLIKCEFWKLKRKKFVWFMLLFSFVFPLLMAIAVPNMNMQADSKGALYDTFWQSMLCYGELFILPCLIGIFAALIFFAERDNDTFKSLRVIPVDSTQLIFSKIAVLVIFALAFCVLSTLFSFVICLVMPQTYEITEPLYKLGISLLIGFMIVLSAMPLVLAVVFFSKNIIFSVMISFFYTVLNFYACSLLFVVPTWVAHWLPTPSIMLWVSLEMQSHMHIPGQESLQIAIDKGLPLSTFSLIMHLLIVATVSLLLVIYVYRKREE